jgi:hypothetical protein
MKFVGKIFFSLLLFGMAVFSMTVFMPENVKNAVEIFKNFF